MTLSTLDDNLTDSRTQRQTMVDCQIRTFDVTDQRLIARVLAVPRERYVPAALRDLAYSDVGLTMPPDAEAGEPRYLLPPLILVRLIQGGRIRSADRVLDVAPGAGYSTAILAGLAASVDALETGRQRCADLKAGLDHVGPAPIVVHEGRLADGVGANAPFDVILVNGAVESGLEPLLAQLSDGGRLLAILRSPRDTSGRAAKAICFEKRGEDVGTRYLFDASAPVLSPFAAPRVFEF